MNKVRIDTIDIANRSYCVSYPIEDDLLAASIERFGVLVPVGLLQSDPTCVITGFKRIAAAKKAGVEEIPCIFLDIDERAATLMAIADNLKRPLNTIEKARCLERMIARDFSIQDVLAMARMTGLPAREKTLETVVALESLDEAVRTLIVERNLSLAVVEQLLWFDGEETIQIARIFGSFKTTNSHIREALHLMALLKVRQGHIDLRQREGATSAEALMQELKRVTHPHLTDLEEQLGRIRATCALPPHIRVQVDPVFEKEAIDIQVRARNEAEVGDALKKLDALARQGIFRSIFDLTHGKPGRN